MKNFYISSKNGDSGIFKYSQDFYELILKEKGYIFVDSKQSVSTILSLISSKDHVHIELDIFQKNEIEIFFLMLKANYRHVSVTLHDAPLIKYPFYEFKNPLLNTISRLYDKYFNNFRMAITYMKKIKAIYVLSKKGLEAVRRKYHVENVYLLPRIINSTEIKKNTLSNNNFIYCGIIDRNKDIEYSLLLHQQLLTKYPDIAFFIIGIPSETEKSLFHSLKEKYQKNVHYYDHVQEEKLNDIFDQATFALLSFRNYKFPYPSNGRILENLKKGKIVLTTKVNGTAEIIENGRTGFYLSGVLKTDTEALTQIFNNKALLETVKEEVYNYLLLNHSAENVRKNLIN